jgi:uncharacterized protein YndB with AHSA1/START domain
MGNRIQITRNVQVSPTVVYRAFTTDAGLQSWLCDRSQLDARASGHYFIWTRNGYQSSGVFHKLVEDEFASASVLTPHPGNLEIGLTATETGTQISLEQTFDQIDAETLASQETIWMQALDNLNAVLEEGLDQRYYNRPMLGVLIAGQIDLDNQARFGIPVDYGIAISGTVPGMGAESMGLQSDDVLVELAGLPLKDYAALTDALQPVNAGDTIKVVWYRGDDLHQSELLLSGRPTPDIPGSAVELAEEVRQIYARLDAELAEVLDDISEAEADYRPEEGEWNAKEILGHTIATERSIHLWITNASKGRVFEHWASNDDLIVGSIVDVHNSTVELRQAIQQAHAQTVALIKRLPENIVEHKGTFHHIVTTVNKHGIPIHTRQHYERIQELIKQARRAAAA